MIEDRGAWRRWRENVVYAEFWTAALLQLTSQLTAWTFELFTIVAFQEHSVFSAFKWVGSRSRILLSIYEQTLFLTRERVKSSTSAMIWMINLSLWTNILKIFFLFAGRRHYCNWNGESWHLCCLSLPEPINRDQGFSSTGTLFTWPVIWEDSGWCIICTLQDCLFISSWPFL